MWARVISLGWQSLKNGRISNKEPQVESATYMITAAYDKKGPFKEDRNL